jgi:hypothetical protein
MSELELLVEKLNKDGLTLVEKVRFKVLAEKADPTLNAKCRCYTLGNNCKVHGDTAENAS